MPAMMGQAREHASPRAAFVHSGARNATERASPERLSDIMETLPAMSRSRKSFVIEDPSGIRMWWPLSMERVVIRTATSVITAYGH